MQSAGEAALRAPGYRERLSWGRRPRCGAAHAARQVSSAGWAGSGCGPGAWDWTFDSGPGLGCVLGERAEYRV